MNKLVSVIIPTYNRANIIKDAIETVLNQTYQNFEIIVVDDGSTDKTEKVVKSFNDSRIRYIYQPNSGKPSVARNLGINSSKGDFVAFLDSDDLWHPQMLEKHVEVLNANAKLGFTTDWSSYRTFDGKEIFQKICCAENSKEYIKYLLLTPDKAYAGPSTCVIRKECFEKSGLFDESMTFCEDWDLFFRLALHFEMHNIHEILTYVRIHQESISKTNDVVNFREGYLKFLQKAFENKDLPSEMLKIKKQAYSNALWCIGGWALEKSKNYSIARQSFLESFENSHCKILNPKFMVKLILSYSPEIFLEGFSFTKKYYRKLLRKES